MLKVVVQKENYLAMLKGLRDVIKDEHTKAMQRLGLAILADFIRSRFRGNPGVKNRTGFLKRGGFQEVVTGDNRRELRVGVAGVKYARIQELGGTVRPVRKKWLTIPVGPALTPAGVARGPARSFPGLVFRLVNPSLALLVGKAGKGKNAKEVVYFVLRKSVRLIARLGFFPTWRAWFQGGKARTFLVRTISETRKRLRGKATR